MKSRPFLVKQPVLDNARVKLQTKSDKWESAYPIGIFGPVVVPWGWLLPHWMLPSTKPKQEPIHPPTDTGSRDKRLAQLSSLPTSNNAEPQNCFLLSKLPLELRQAIYTLVIGNDTFRLISVPWKVIAVPDIDGNVSMTQAHFSANNLSPLNFIAVPNEHEQQSQTLTRRTEPLQAAPPLHGRGNALLLTCRHIFNEAIELLYSTNTFIIHDFHTFQTFARSVPAGNLNAIRSFKVHWSPETSIPYKHERTPQYDLPIQLDWFWEIVIGMKGIRHLDVYLEAYFEIWQKNVDYEASEKRRLEPLLTLRGLLSFNLEIGYIAADGSKSFEPRALAFREELIAVVKQPKVG